MKKKILIISGEAWRDESNGGNVLSNLFEPLKDDFEFAQIYTHPSLPNNKICKKYFHLSESEMIRKIFGRSPFGNELFIEKNQNLRETNFSNNNKIISLRKYFPNLLYIVQDILWRYSKWKNPSLEKFILDFNPDIIFAPMYGGIFLHRLDRYVAKITEKKLISYVSDDHLLFRQFSLSPFFWVYRIMLRYNVLKTSKYYSLLYTMTQEQLVEYQPILQIPMKVLKKAKKFDKLPSYSLPPKGVPIRIIYGGNLIYNRYKTLAKLVEAIKEVNIDEVHFQLYVYTQTPINSKLKKLLHDGKNTFLKGKISLEQLDDEYKKSDIVLHVESFDLKQKLATRLSFSTKIIDLIHSGRTILAICWSKSSPYYYLTKNDIAITVSERDSIAHKLREILFNREIISKYAQKTWYFGLENHQIDKVVRDFKNDLENAK